MTDQELLKAIREITREEASQLIQESEQRMEQRMDQRMDQRIRASEERMDQKLQDLQKELIHSMQIIIENVVTPKFNLLSERLDILAEKIPDPEDAERLEERVSALEVVVKKHSREINELKKAT